MEIIHAKDYPERFSEFRKLALESWRDTDLRALLWDYYASIEAENFEDLSVAVMYKKEPVLLALANNAGGILGYYRQPIRILQAPEISHLEAEKKRVTSNLIKITKSKSFDCLIMSDDLQQMDGLSDWQTALMDQGADFKIKVVAQANVSQSEEDLWRGVRKRFRPFINKAKSTMRLETINAMNFQESSFRAFQEFHFRTSGRLTRPLASWDMMLDFIRTGKAELVQGYLDESLVASTYVFYTDLAALYGTGVYDRDKFEHNISHWPMYFSMLRARDRKNNFFTLGEVYPLGSSEKKLKDIAFFKKGFTSRVILQGEWRFSPER